MNRAIKVIAGFLLIFGLIANVFSQKAESAGEKIIGIKKKSETITSTSPVIKAEIIKIGPSGALVKKVAGKVYITRTELGHIQLQDNFRLIDGDLIELLPDSKLLVENLGQLVEFTASENTSWYKFLLDDDSK